jgi:glycerol-3-phosphate cytidylyltransferase
MNKKSSMSKKIGVTAGAFDLCHAGHMLMFKEAKNKCDYLIVLLHSDPTLDRAEKNKPIMTIEERTIILQGIRYIDEILVYHTEKELYRLLKEIQPDVRIIGADWQGKPYTGHDLPITTYFNSRGHKYSSSELRCRVYEAERKKN